MSAAPRRRAGVRSLVAAAAALGLAAGPAAGAPAAGPAPAATGPTVPAEPPRDALPGSGPAVEEAPPAEPPPTPEPSAGPAPPPAELTPEQAAARDALAARLVEARAGLAAAELRRDEAAARVVELDAAVSATGTDLAASQAAHGQAAEAAEQAQARVRRWGVRLYAGASLRPLAILVEVDRIESAPRRLGLTRGAIASARRTLERQRAVQVATGSDVLARTAALAELAQAAGDAQVAAAAAEAQVEAWQRDIASLEAGQDIAVGGMVFPLLAASAFTDTFGAPRMTGTRFAHAHQGVDIFGPAGSPVIAVERGVLARVGVDVLGGNKLWLVGQSGTRYYYAHLQGFAAGVRDGLAVQAGQALGAVGNTGNARGTPYHLHLEIHPPGRAAVNPYPILRYVVEGAPAPVGGR